MRPDFLCIGAQKSGTTWLYHALCRHPQIRMPPVKEIHYFDRGDRPYILDLLSRKAPTRRRLMRWLREGGRAGLKGWSELHWCVRFFCLPRSDAWYTSLFTRPDGIVTGDITPGYARMERDRVARVHRLLPDARILYLLRDPIDRAWSQAAMYFRQYHGSASIADVDPAEVRRFVLNPYNLRNGEYSRTLALWQEYYPAERMLLLSHDAIERNPASALLRVYAFLSVEADPSLVPPGIRERVYTQPYPPVPPELAAELARHFYPSLLQLHRQGVVPDASRWLARARSLLDRADGASGARRDTR